MRTFKTGTTFWTSGVVCFSPKLWIASQKLDFELPNRVETVNHGILAQKAQREPYWPSRQKKVSITAISIIGAARSYSLPMGRVVLPMVCLGFCIFFVHRGS
jgi:hypothetical protein